MSGKPVFFVQNLQEVTGVINVTYAELAELTDRDPLQIFLQRAGSGVFMLRGSARTENQAAATHLALHLQNQKQKFVLRQPAGVHRFRIKHGQQNNFCQFVQL